MSPMAAETLGVIAQCVFFLVGLMLSVAVGMGLAKLFDGPGPLLIATVISGTGLLTFAALSQKLRDEVVRRALK